MTDNQHVLRNVLAQLNHRAAKASAAHDRAQSADAAQSLQEFVKYACNTCRVAKWSSIPVRSSQEEVISLERLQKKAAWKRVIQSSEDCKEIQAIVTRLDMSLQSFQV